MKIRQITNHGAVRFELDLGRIDGKRQRQFFRTLPEAERALTEEEQRRKKGSPFARIPARDQAELFAVYEDAKEAGISLRALLDAHMSKRDSVPTHPESEVSLQFAVNDFLVSKRRDDHSYAPSYLESLEVQLGKFSRGREAASLSEIARGSHVEQYLYECIANPESRRTAKTRLGAFFSHCIQVRQWLKPEDHPVPRLPKIGRVKSYHREVAIQTVKQARTGLQWVASNRPQWLAWYVLALFEGVRPEELDKLSWDNVDLTRGTLSIPARIAKTGIPRIIELYPVTLAWLKLAKANGAPIGIPKATRRRYLRALREHYGIKAWPHDWLRHTAGSFGLAHAQGNATLISGRLGNSVGILLKHYISRSTVGDAEEFYALFPGGADNVVAFQATA